MSSIKELYVVTDVISGEELCYLSANNPKECIRNLVQTGLFKYNRVEDIKVESCGIAKFDKMEVIDVKKVLEELSYKIEDKAEKISGTPDEVKNKIIDKIENKK